VGVGELAAAQVLDQTEDAAEISFAAGFDDARVVANVGGA
jgi:hypothetical protein